ncbi:MAG: hypothetical protein SFY69_05045 [Planctomycetota bacterium]|nr:hypothetical protein [Planctomycetota bacterium]
MRIAASFVAVGALASIAAGQISYTGGVYSQNFDGLPSSGTLTQTGRGPHALNPIFGDASLDGWFGGNPGGSNGNTEFRAQDGSLAGSAGRGVVSFGTTGSGERALGALPTSNQISHFGALFTNNTGATLTDITISYTGEQWRRGDVADPQFLGFFYGLGSSIADAMTAESALSFSSANTQAAPLEVALNGNDPMNKTLVTATISGVNWTPGSTLAIRWLISEQSGQDDGLAVDDFSLRAVPAPGAGALLGLGAIVALRRRR